MSEDKGESAHSTPGYVNLVLHAHLPFVYRPERSRMIEEEWFFQACTECYIPLLSVLERLTEKNRGFSITISLSPTLLSMMRNRVLTAKYMERLSNLIELCTKEETRLSSDSRFRMCARFYRQRLSLCRKKLHEDYSWELTTGFKELYKTGCIDLITTSATHAFLPNLQFSPENIKAQVETGIEVFRSVFGKHPEGFWLPECGYFPGVDSILKEAGIEYTFTDSHGILFSELRPRYGIYAPAECRENGLSVFPRDPESSELVWNAETGYPGNPLYREYYRDIGYELSADYLGKAIDPSGIRTDTGLKYWRITGNQDKEPYIRRPALRQAESDAGKFIRKCSERINQIGKVIDRKPVLTVPFDAELFGHWWFEGPEWIYCVIKGSFEREDIKFSSSKEYLSEYGTNQPLTPCASTWGKHGFSSMWLNHENDWIVQELYRASEEMKYWAHNLSNASGIIERVLNQMVRELMLAESSDWQFIISTNTSAEYAKARVHEHTDNFWTLSNMLGSGEIDIPQLELLETKTPLLQQEADFKHYS